MLKKFTSALLAAALLGSMFSAMAAGPVSVEYAALENQIKRNNIDYKIADNNYSISMSQSLAVMHDTTALNMKYWELDDQAKELQKQLEYMSPSDPLYKSYSLSLTALDESMRSLDYSIDQVTKAETDGGTIDTSAYTKREQTLKTALANAKKLYISNFASQAERASAQLKYDLQKKTDEKNRAKYAAGLISKTALDASAKELDKQRDALDALEPAAKKNLADLKSVLGIDQSSDIKLGALPDFDPIVIDKINLASDMALYLENSTDLISKRDALKSAKSNGDDTVTPELTLKQAETSARISFEDSYNSLKKQYKALTDLQSQLADSRKTLADTEKKLTLGKVSAAAAQAQRDAVKTAELDITVSKLNLFAAFTAYQDSKYK